ncbi:pentapeptide repeat-containing protein [Actinomadura montaniterrae]|uniref:pentapeptide repeat-containing protein n=1 Tax=Actinomadura montaniterrae TaxID=1803903 RepID=UPI00178C7547|nr:pentapeptide repeat-containing protein [Actinomadura montaniterrae]
MGEVAPGGAHGRVRRGLEPVRRRWAKARAGREAKPLRVRPLAAGFWMLAAAGAAALAIWLTTAWLLDVADDAPPGAERAKIRVDAVRTGLAAGGGAGAAVGLMLAFRRQRHAELATALGQLDAAERRITELYNAAAEQLASDKAPVRLTALYTLKRLANDNPRHRQTIVDIICAYLRMPCTPPPAQHPGPEEEHRERARRNAARYRAAREHHPATTEPSTGNPDPYEEHQVRLTAQRLLSTHLQPTADPHWADISLDLTGATLSDFKLTGCTVHRAVFSGATFFGDAVFTGATFSGAAWFNRATFSGDAAFIRANFSKEAVFWDATFSGPAVFGRATFSRAAWFRKATFSGTVTFDGATFSRNAWSSGLGAMMSSDAAVFGEAHSEVGVDMDWATVANVTGGHNPPPGWRIEPSEGSAGLFVRDPAPATGS